MESLRKFKTRTMESERSGKRRLRFGVVVSGLLAVLGAFGMFSPAAAGEGDTGFEAPIPQNDGSSESTVSSGLGFTASQASHAGPLEDPVPEPIEAGPVQAALEPVAGGLTAPNWGTAAPGDADHLYVSDQTGIVWRIHVATGEKEVFADLRGRIVNLGVFGPGSFDERGLLGIAFHPGYQENGLFYTYTSEALDGPADFSTMSAREVPDHQSVVSEWRVPDPGSGNAKADPEPRREILRIDQPQFNHNAGNLEFGPDGFLYISLGDGGGSGETSEARDPSSVLGSILRIDPLGGDSANGQYGIPADNPFAGQEGFRGEVFAYGFRNPFRFSFDDETGRLYGTDVGQNNIEEVNLVEPGGNYGWDFKEGSFFFLPGEGVTDVDPGVPPGLVDPFAQYDHDEGLAVIGGFVYRGEEIPELEGSYVFGDFSQTSNDGRLFYLEDGRIWELSLAGREELGLSLLGFGQDARGELYALANATGTPFGETGVVLKLASPCRMGGTGAGAEVGANVDTARCGTATLLLSRQAAPPASGKLFVSLEAPTVPELSGQVFFRPSDEALPLSNGGYVALAATDDGFLPGAGQLAFAQGPTGGRDLSFVLGTSGLQGQTVVFETLFLDEGLELSEANLRTLQSVTARFQ